MGGGLARDRPQGGLLQLNPLAKEGRLSLAILQSRAQLGTDAPPVTIEVFLSGGLPSFAIVGMPETAVRESKDRVRSAIITSGFTWPRVSRTFPRRWATGRSSPSERRTSAALRMSIVAA